MTTESSIPNKSEIIPNNIFVTMLHVTSNIKRARKLTGLSQEDFAEKIGVKRSTYAEWEGKIIPDLITLKKIADEANTTLSELIGEEIKEKRQDEKDHLTLGIYNLTESNRMLAEANLKLATKISSDASGPVSSASQVTKKVSRNPVASVGLGKQGKNSSGNQKQKDSVKG